LSPLKPSNLSAQTYSFGSLRSTTQYSKIIEGLNAELEALGKESKLAKRLHTTQYSKIIEGLNAELEALEKESKLQKRLRKYKKSEPAETWASRWVASPIAYLFPEERREEWLGDLYEVNREMIRKGYGRWLVNLINVGKTVVLVLSAVQIKVSDFISIGKTKSD